MYPAGVLHTCPPPHLAADAESLQWVEAEPASVSCLFEAVHKLCVERPLEGRQTHQDHMLLFGGQLVLQDVMTSSGIKDESCIQYLLSVMKENEHEVKSDPEKLFILYEMLNGGQACFSGL